VLIDAAVTESKGAPFTMKRLELDDLRADEVLVKVVACGICHTDLIIRDQWYPVPLPAVLGHEGAGVVEAVGAAVSKVKPGDHVALSYGSCGACAKCHAGEPWTCHDFFARNFGAARPDGSTALRDDGRAIHSHFFGQSSFATYAVSPERSVVRLAPDVPLDIVAPFGCGIQTGAGAVLNALRLQPGDALLVTGTGAVGMSAVMAARAAGAAAIVAVDPVASRRALALTLGATHALDPADVARGALDRIEVPLDFAIDTSGRPEMIRAAVAAVHSAGVVLLLAAGRTDTVADIPLRDLIVGRQVRGAVEGDAVPQLLIPRLLELWRVGQFPVEALVSTFAAAELGNAMRAMKLGHVVKPVVMFDE
jgi:aryl-alcohol dehydrogenase